MIKKNRGKHIIVFNTDYGFNCSYSDSVDILLFHGYWAYSKKDNYRAFVAFNCKMELEIKWKIRLDKV